MAKEELLEFDGTVTEVLPDGNFRVKPYDLQRGRISFRHKGDAPAPSPQQRRPNFRRR
jgi:translation initiation factor IF-1